MDLYTARCLQVSTNGNDGLPPSRRRPSAMMKRQNSVVDSRTVPVRPTHQRSKTSITGMWPVQTEMSKMPAAYHGVGTPMSMQSQRFTSPQSSVASPFDTPFQMSYMTPITPYTPAEWNMPMAIDAKQLSAMNMDLSDQAFALNGSEAQEDIIHMNNNGVWNLPSTDYLDRRASTADSDITDITDANIPSAAASTYDDFGDRDERRSRSLHRHSRSLSRTPASRTASKRAMRRQLSCQPVSHGRTMSIGPYMPTLPQTPSVPNDPNAQDALAMEFGGHGFLNSGMADNEMIGENSFQENFNAVMDVTSSMSRSASSHATRMMTPPGDMVFWDQGGYEMTDLLSSPSNHADEHEHAEGGGCCQPEEDAEKPDLFESLRQEPSNPPEEDMHPEDPDMVPQEQEPRFEGDLYTPRWVRGTGNKREGYCGLCKPGRWLVLKNSAYWYDKSFTHGVSAATGQPFEAPRETRRMAGNPDVWEGLCGGCGDWIALISSKKKGTTWFRHAYKCHSKNKDKKQRQVSPVPAQASATTTSMYANMKPIPMPMTTVDMHANLSQSGLATGGMFQVDGVNMNMGMNMTQSQSMEMHPGDASVFPEMTFLS